MRAIPLKIITWLCLKLEKFDAGSVVSGYKTGLNTTLNKLYDNLVEERRYLDAAFLRVALDEANAATTIKEIVDVLNKHFDLNL